MTPRQRQLLDAIVRYRDAHGFAPSYRELLPMVGLSANSLGALTQLIKALERDGYVRRLPGRARNIEVLQLADGSPCGLSAAEVAWCHAHADQVRALQTLVARVGG